MRESVSSGEEFVHLSARPRIGGMLLKHLAAHDKRKWKQKVDDQREDTVYDACRGVLLLGTYIIIPILFRYRSDWPLWGSHHQG